MSSTLTTFEVRQEGQSARLVRFASPQITIGFHQDCDLPLEPCTENGSEVQLMIQPRGPCLLRATRDPGKFLLNGKPFIEEMNIACGDVIAQLSYQITVRSLPGATGENQPKADANRQERAARPKDLRSDAIVSSAAAVVGSAATANDKAPGPEPNDEPATRAVSATQPPS